VYVGPVALRVITWNLMHGRSIPPAGRNLLDEFTRALGGWQWDIALLQEVPPWWPAELGPALSADWRMVLTSRNFGLPVRRAVAMRWPDLIKSNGGGANAILARGEAGAIAEHRTHRLAWWPERRWLHGVRLVRDELPVWVGNLHCTVHDAPAALREGRAAASVVRAWAQEAPAVLGGDFNERGLTIEHYSPLAVHDVDYVFASHGLRGSEASVLERGRLSDHAPVAVTVDFAGAKSP
jgi:endonuclease/exonuclease/phosphatase family metal-dependent hydrolase